MTWRRRSTARYGGAADAFDLVFPPGTPAGQQRELLADLHRIPHQFQRFATGATKP